MRKTKAFVPLRGSHAWLVQSGTGCIPNPSDEAMARMRENRRKRQQAESEAA